MRISDWSSDVCSSDLDTLDGGDDNGDDLVRIDAIGASITTTNVGGDTFLNLSTVLTDFDYDSTNIDDIEGLLITDQPIFKAGDVVAGTTLVDSNTDGVIDADDHAFMADIDVRVPLDPGDLIHHEPETTDASWVQEHQG